MILQSEYLRTLYRLLEHYKQLEREYKDSLSCASSEAQMQAMRIQKQIDEIELHAKRSTA